MSVLTALRTLLVPTLLAALILALLQWLNQYKLHRATPHSEQRRLCYIAASATLLLAIVNACNFAVFIAYVFNGLSPGRIDPGTFPIPYALITALCFFVAYGGLLLIVLASLHRYYRLCSVEKRSVRETIFLIAKIGSIVSCAIAFVADTVETIVFTHFSLKAIGTLVTGFPMLVDFIANYSVSSTYLTIKMINRALVINAAPREDSDGDLMERNERITTRRDLKDKLLFLFGLTLSVNVINLTIYSLRQFFMPHLYTELALFSSCALSFYIVTNLYLLDLLRDGVLNPPKEKKKRYIRSSIDRGNNGSANEYPDMLEPVELQSMINQDRPMQIGQTQS